MRLAVVDTNVVVSGVLTGGTNSPTARILDAMLAGRLPFVLSDALLVEYRVVLLRPAIRRRHRLDEDEVDAILEALVVNAGFRDPATADEDPDDDRPAVEGDDHVIALVAVTPGAVLVTGDRRLAEAVAEWRSSASPAAFAGSLG